MILAISFSAALYAQQSTPPGLFEGQPVTAVDLIGRPTINVESFRHFVRQVAGEPYSAQKIQASAAALKAAGQFTDVETNVIPEEKGLRVEFIMEPVFYVGTFDFPGALQSFSYAQLLGIVRYPPEEPYEQSRAEEGEASLKRFFGANGYFTATIQTETRIDDAKQLVNIIYRVDLNRKARYGAIEIVGLSPDLTSRLRNSLHSIRARLHGANIREGKPYDPDHVRAAERFLRDDLGKRNYLSSRITLEPPRYDAQSNRASLRFNIVLGPIVVVRASGAHVSTRTLRKQIPIYEENDFDQDLVNIGTRNLTSYFQGKGYFDTRIKAQIDAQASKTTLTYDIARGRKHRVREVALSGNKAFDREQVKDQILLKQSHFLSRGKFSEDLLNKTTANLEAYWQNAGYEDVKVTPRLVDREPDIYVTFEISEGERTVVDSFQTVGNQNQEVAKLFSQLLIKEGGAYSPYRAAQDRNRVIAEYLNLGYLNATLQVQAKPSSSDKHHVAVTYEIDEGPQVRVSQVIYDGQKRSRIGLLDRAVGIRAETEMSESKLLEGESNLYNLGVFDWASVAPRRPINHQTEEHVLVKVHEARRNSITYGVGFESTPRSGSLSSGTLVLPGLPTVGLPRNFAVIEKTVISPLGSISYSRLNMRGRSETLSVSALISALDQKGSIAYSDPHFFGTNWSSLLAISAERTTQNPLFAAQLGQGSLQLERNLDAAKTRKLQLRYSFQHTSLDHLLIQNFVPAEDLHTHLSTISATFLRDTRDKPLDAHKGFYQTVDFQLSPTVLGSSDNVARLFGQTSYYRQILPWLVFANNVRIGLISTFAGSHVPFADRFFSGGADSLRGFPLNGAGPQATALLCTQENAPSTCTADVTVPRGGLQLFIFNSEARFPIPIKKGLGGVVFYDGGNVYQSINLHELTRDYGNSVGLGLRYQTPVGPVRIDIGRNLNPVPGLKSTQIFVTLGQSF